MMLPCFGPGELRRNSDSLRARRPGIEPRWGPPSFLYDEYRVISGGGEIGRGVALTTHTNPAPRLKKGHRYNNSPHGLHWLL